MIRPLLLAALLAVAGPATAQAPSEAERAAEADRPRTAEEQSRTAAECEIVVEPAGSIADFLGRESVSVVSAPAIQVLRLVDFRTGETGIDDGSFEELAPLPFGGIGRADMCDGFHLLYFDAEDGPGRLLYTMGVRLRPGLDLLDAYPTTGREIVRRDQLVELPAAEYLQVEARAGRGIDEGEIRQSDDPRIDRARPMFVLSPGIALVPLARAPR